MKNKLWVIMLIIIISCTKNTKQTEADIIEVETIDNDVVSESISTSQKIKISLDNYDWITELDWTLLDGRDYVDPSAIPFDWIGNMAPIVRIYKFEIPQGTDLYQARQRDEQSWRSKNNLFYFFYYEPEGEKTIFLENTGRSPLLNAECRLIDPAECLYYMYIDREIPSFAIRRGTYLLKQTGEKEFETISSFQDGLLRLELVSDLEYMLKYGIRMLITPLFTLEDKDEGIVGHLMMWAASLDRPRFSPEEDE